MSDIKFTTINRPTHDKQNYTAGESQQRELDPNAIELNERSRTVPDQGYNDDDNASDESSE